MNKFRRHLLLIPTLFGLLVGYSKSYSQSTVGDSLLKIDIDILSRDTIYTNPDCFLYTAVLSVINTQDTVVSFWISTGSWQRYNWVTTNDSVSIFYLGCDFCNEDLISLPPHKSLKFFAPLIGKKNL